MKKTTPITITCMLISALAYQAVAQQQSNPRHESLPPLMRALDLDTDGVLSWEEINTASRVLKKLDKNGDFRLTLDEVVQTPPKPNQRLTRYMMKQDANNDGKLSPEELGDRYKEMFEYDKDQDGFLSSKEILYAVDKYSSKPVGAPQGDSGPAGK
ncbi:MAG: hypothetical protein KDB27_17530 [Planctomycetales bacterium]|nr:hypothetical protein [Planctomycetales bacterium]